MENRLDTLDLVGDGDELELILEVERMFGVSFDDAEFAGLGTVGDLHRLVAAKLATDEPTTACFSQIAFHRIRAAARARGVATPITPSTPIQALFPPDLAGHERRRAWTSYEKLTGLRFPEWTMPDRKGQSAPDARRGWPGFRFLAVALPAALITVFLLAFPYSMLAIVAACGVWAWRRRKLDIPSRIATIGDLCREAAGESFERLREARASRHPNDLFQAIVAICRSASGASGPIGAETTLHASSARERRSA